MDNELYELAYALKGYNEKAGWNIVMARKEGNQWKLIIEREQKVAQDDNNKRS